jgi:two-component sensor histidine kinase
MWFDAATAVVIHGAIDFLLFLAALYAWKVSVRLPSALYWSLGLFAFLIGHVAMFLYYMPKLAHTNPWAIILPALGYMAHALGLLALAKGSELLLEQSVKAWWSWLLIILGFLGGGFFGIIVPSEPGRILVGNIVYMGIGLRGFAAFHTGTKSAWNPGITGTLAGLSFLGMAILNVARAAASFFDWPSTELFTSGLYNSLHAIMVVGLFLTLSQLIYTRFNDTLHLKIQENDLLVRELHHRTKNNFALVASIVALEGGQLQDEAAKEALVSVQGRVLALSTLYERLQHGEKSGEMDLGEYLRDIARGVASSIGRDGIAILDEALVSGVVAPLSAAIPLGLIVNELITNALKHAFPAGRGVITLSLFRKAGELTLCIEDNGIGKTETQGAQDQRRGLGSAILEALIQQLEGSLQYTYSSLGGTRAELLVPMRPMSGDV